MLMGKYVIQPIIDKDFYQLEKSWQLCVENSDANLLFSSWIWQKTWWQIWGERLNLNLFLLGVFQNNILIGIVPCYTYIYKNKLGFKIKRCEFIGNYSASDDSIRSEYLDFILPKDQYPSILPYIFSYFKRHSIDECILRDMLSSSVSVRWLGQSYNHKKCLSSTSVQVNTTNSFDLYLTSLGKSTRLQMFNRRKLLSDIKVVGINQKYTIDVFFDLLNLMHTKRWGKKCFSDHSLIFHKVLSKHFEKKGFLKSKVIIDKHVPQAVCYDIAIGGVCYNIQLGFELDHSKKISMGMLMLGYAIESSFKHKGTEEYDLLAGGGKKTFYKDRFKGAKKELVSVLIPLSYTCMAITILKNMVYSIKKLKKKT